MGSKLQPRSCSSAAGVLPFCLCFVQCRGRFSIVARTPNVQGWSADEVTDDDDTYQSFPCIACTRVHMVNLKTGKVLGEQEE